MELYITAETPKTQTTEHVFQYSLS